MVGLCECCILAASIQIIIRLNWITMFAKHQYNWIIIVLLLFLPGFVRSQASDPGTFSQEQFFQMILANHPVARQASLLGAEADAYILKARGGFDPKLKGDWEQKSFDGKNYFTIGEVGFSVPTWYGIEVKGAYHWNDGIFLNPERTLPAGGQAEIGVEFSLLQGLMIDERRATLQQARIMQQLNEAERLSILNDLLMEANEVYWDWSFSYQVVRIYEEALRLAEIRFDGIYFRYQQGFNAAVDTLESGIQVQNRRVSLQEARLNLQNAELALSTFLWTQDDVPLVFDSSPVAPPMEGLDFLRITQTELNDLARMLRTQHPDLMQYIYQLDQLMVDERLKREMLKPELSMRYSLLGDRFNFNSFQQENDGTIQNILGQNYKWGFSARFPLFLRKQRADLSLNQIKQQQTTFKQSQKQLSLENKLEMYANNTNTILQQINAFEGIVQDTRNLLQAENDRFTLGSSSLFLINSREVKLIETQEKLANLQAKFQKNRVAI